MHPPIPYPACSAVACAAVWALALTGCQSAPAPATGPSAAIAEGVDRITEAYPGPLQVGVWIGDGQGATTFERNPNRALATASAIKTAYLVEWFDEFSNRLDEPMDAVRDVAEDPEHPAIAHFAPGHQREIASILGSATVREIGCAMIRSERELGGVRVSNAVYNAAANIVTAVLGGPAALTDRIHARFPNTAAQDLHVRRYMLARRDLPQGDNTATAAGLGAVLEAIATGTVPGMDAATQAALRPILQVSPPSGWRRHFRKTGALDSDPQCRIRSGWVEDGSRTRTYAIMAQQPDGAVPAQALERLVEDLNDLLLRDEQKITKR